MLHSSNGEHAVALRFLEEAVALRRQAGDQRRLMSSLSWFGNVLAWSDPDRAYAIHTEVLAFRRASGDERGVVGAAYASVQTERLRELRASLDEDAFAAAWAEGQALGFDAAFAVARTALEEMVGARTGVP